MYSWGLAIIGAASLILGWGPADLAAVGAASGAGHHLFVAQQPHETCMLTQPFAAEDVGVLGQEALSIGVPTQEQGQGHTLKVHTLSCPWWTNARKSAEAHSRLSSSLHMQWGLFSFPRQSRVQRGWECLSGFQVRVAIVFGWPDVPGAWSMNPKDHLDSYESELSLS